MLTVQMYGYSVRILSMVRFGDEHCYQRRTRGCGPLRFSCAQQNGR